MLTGKAVCIKCIEREKTENSPSWMQFYTVCVSIIFYLWENTFKKAFEKATLKGITFTVQTK